MKIAFLINLNGRDTYMVLFDTDNEVLGSIRVFVDKASFQVLGMVFEDRDLQ